MKSDQVERWLTLISHIAVLVGIVAVVAELRQNSAVMRAQIGQARADNITAPALSRQRRKPTSSAIRSTEPCISPSVP